MTETKENGKPYHAKEMIISSGKIAYKFLAKINQWLEKDCK